MLFLPWNTKPNRCAAARQRACLRADGRPRWRPIAEALHAPNPVRENLERSSGRAARRRPRADLHRPSRAARAARAARVRRAGEAAPAGAAARPDVLGDGPYRRHQAGARRQHQSVGRGLPQGDARGQRQEQDQGFRSARSGAGHFARGRAGARHGAAGRDACGARQSRQHRRRRRSTGVRLRHDRACAYPRDASDGDEAAEADAGPARRQALAACHGQGRGAADHCRDRRVRRARSCRRICRLGDPRHADRAAHDAVQSQHRDGRPFGLRRARRRDVPMDRRAALCAAGRDVGSRAGALADACGPTMAPSSTARSCSTATASSRRSPGAPTRAWCSAFPAACPTRPPPPIRPARRDRKRARLHGTFPRHGARRPAGESGVHRLLHQRPAAGPAGRRRRGARPARRRRRDRHGGAGLVDGEARGGGRGPRPGVPRRRILLGRVRLLDVRRRQRRPRRAGRALRLDHQPEFRAPPGHAGAHASGQPGDRGGNRDRRPHRRRAANLRDAH